MPGRIVPCLPHQFSISIFVLALAFLSGCGLVPDNEPGTSLMPLYPCGTCDPTCRTEGFIDPGEDPCWRGWLDRIDAAYAWIPHHTIGQASKMDLRSGDCIARYKVGLTGTGSDSPSGVAVDGQGNVYIASRAPGMIGSITKIAGDQRFCDPGEDRILQTSTSCGNILSLSSDECVLWTASLPEAGTCSQGSMHSLVVDYGDDEHEEGFPWAGSLCTNTLYKLDPDTGAVLDFMEIDIPPFGAVMDNEGWIWSTCRGCGDGAIQAFHSETLEKGAVIGKPRGICGPGWGYGITVDNEGRIWVGSWLDPGGKPCRYDPQAHTWFAPPGSAIECAGHLGIAAGHDGRMWSACWEHGKVWRFNADDGGDQQYFNVGCGPHGVSTDAFGKVWVANATCQRITRIDPDTGSWDTFTTGAYSSDAYGLFAGIRHDLRRSISTWTRVFERCDVTILDRWGEISWDITTPSNSLVTIYGRSADTVEDLETAPMVTMAVTPPSAPPKDIESVFHEARAGLGRYLEISVEKKVSTDGQCPVFVSIYTTFHCY
ncbi:MAG: hypothetical protein ABIJ56_09005 [Pseudomonadota bacterium]